LGNGTLPQWRREENPLPDVAQLDSVASSS
jgi:hypothetical protein